MSRPSLVAGLHPSAKHPTIPCEGDNSTILDLEAFRKNADSSQRLSPTKGTSDQERVHFPLTIDSDLSAEAQAILQRTCGEEIDAIELEPLIRKHQTKLWIHLKATAYNMALHALILGLPAAEFGSVIHTHTPSHL